MYGIGGNGHKKLFPDREEKWIEGLEEMKIGGQSRVVKAACGMYHTLLLLENGSVMAMGHNRSDEDLSLSPVSFRVSFLSALSSWTGSSDSGGRLNWTKFTPSLVCSSVSDDSPPSTPSAGRCPSAREL